MQGPVNMSTPAILISPGLALPGTVSITSAELYFEVVMSSLSALCFSCSLLLMNKPIPVSVPAGEWGELRVQEGWPQRPQVTLLGFNPISRSVFGTLVNTPSLFYFTDVINNLCRCFLARCATLFLLLVPVLFTVLWIRKDLIRIRPRLLRVLNPDQNTTPIILGIVDNCKKNRQREKKSTNMYIESTIWYHFSRIKSSNFAVHLKQES